MSQPVPLFRPVVVTKSRTYELALDQTGSPVGEQDSGDGV